MSSLEYAGWGPKNGVPYQGINVVLLWIEASLKGYASPTWMTFKQAQAVGACVHKGEKGSMVVYANAVTKTETDVKTGEDSERRIPFLKSYTVFNVAQIDGLRPMPDMPETDENRLTEADRMKSVDMYFAMVGADLRHGGSRAFYAPALDA